MSIRLTSRVTVAVLLTALASASCGDNGNPVDPDAPTVVQTMSFGVNSMKVAPEFLSAGGCADGRAFRTRFDLAIAGGTHGGVVTGVRAGFTDRWGVVAFPTNASGNIPSSWTISSSPTVPVPTNTAVPFPVPSNSSQRVPVTLEFGCQVRPVGTLLVIADLRDEHGMPSSQRVTIEIGE
jgi:hypothetical protein